MPMTAIDSATTMDKIVTQIKTRFKVSTIAPSPRFGHETVITLIAVSRGKLLDRPHDSVALRLVFKVGRCIESQCDIKPNGTCKGNYTTVLVKLNI